MLSASAQSWEKMRELKKSHAAVNVMVTAVTPGGLVVDYYGRVASCQRALARLCLWKW